jgi:hypothetical protein
MHVKQKLRAGSNIIIDEDKVPSDIGNVGWRQITENDVARVGRHSGAQRCRTFLLMKYSRLESVGMTGG